jgi:hypothetical protein
MLEVVHIGQSDTLEREKLQLQPGRWRKQILPKYRYPPSGLHSAIAQKAAVCKTYFCMSQRTRVSLSTWTRGMLNRIVSYVRIDRFYGLGVRVFFTTDPEVPGSIPGPATSSVKVRGLERSPLGFVRTIGELLEWQSSRLRSRKPRLTAVGIRCADQATLYPSKGWH